ncbi:MAG: hypothetical protein B7Z67_04660 [Acidiphilium sp. 21-60-14]|nr:MAG: hypothetical protein B7Z67_04660 [Acidiphilium sp. 21-60-14]
MRSLSERDQPAIRADLKNARRRFYSAIQVIDRLIKIDDETVIERARPLIEVARRLPDGG